MKQTTQIFFSNMAILRERERDEMWVCLLSASVCRYKQNCNIHLILTNAVCSFSFHKQTVNLVLLQKHIVAAIQYGNYYNKSHKVVLTSFCVQVMCECVCASIIACIHTHTHTHVYINNWSPPMFKAWLRPWVGPIHKFCPWPCELSDGSDGPIKVCISINLP